MRNTILFPALFLLMIACDGNPSETQPAQEDTTSNGQPSETGQTIVPPAENAVPTDTSKTVQLVATGTLHAEEFDEKLVDQAWYGIFPGDGFYLEKITLIADRVNDPMVDAEGEKTAWEISQTGSGEPLLLISGIELTEGRITSADLPEQLYPGDSTRFELAGTPYILFASGTRISDTEGTGGCENYSLYLRAEKEGQTITQQLVHFDFFDDALITILFCGDIDGDERPDLVLDNTDHYNVSNPTLYLSGQANNGRLLEIRGWHLTVGC